MVDQDLLDIYSELHRRNEVPAEHRPVVDELVRRGVLKGGDGLSERGRQRMDLERQDNPTGSYTKRLVHSAMLGASDEVNAGLQTLTEYPVRAMQGDSDIGAHWSDNLKTQQAIVNRNRRLTDGGGGMAADVVGGLAMGAPKAIAGAVTAVPTFLQTSKHLAQQGAVWGGSHAFLDTDGGVADRAAAVPDGAIEGAVGANVVGHGINALMRGRGWLADRKTSRAAAADASAREFDDAGVSAFGPAVSDNALLQGSARAIGDTAFGGPLQREARRTVGDIEGRLTERIDNAAGGPQTTADAGRETQAFLRRQLTERSRAKEDVASMSPQQIQDVSGVGPAPGARVKRPVVDPVEPEPWNPQRRRVSDDDVERAMPPVDRGETPRPRTFAPEDVPVPSDMAKRVADAQAAAQPAREVLDKHGGYFRAVARRLADIEASAPPAPRPRPVDMTPGQRAAYAAESDRALVAHNEFWNSPFGVEHRRLSADYRNLKPQVDAAERAMRDYTAASGEMRAYQLKNLEAHQKRENDGAAGLADQNYQMRVAEARRATREQQERIADAEHIQNVNDPARRSAWENKERNRARSETEVNQKRADDVFDADMANRYARTEREPFQMGRSRETYPTEMDVAYEGVRRNAPNIQPELLAPGTNTSKLIGDLGVEARGQMQLRGYKPGQGLTPELAKHLQGSFGPLVTQSLARYAEAGFKPGVDGLRRIRTAIGKEIGDARRASQQGMPRGTDETKLARLYNAVTEDIHAALQGVGTDAGRIASSQLRDVDAGYNVFVNDLRRPLSTLFGDKSDPVQALGELVKAAGPNGRVDLLRRFYRVVDDKGDRLKATAALVNHLRGQDIEGFLKAWRKLTPDARSLMFRGPSAEFGRGIEQLARLAEKMEPYASMARDRGGIMSRTIGRTFTTGNTALVALGHFISMPSAIAGAVGANVAARIMVKPWFISWLRSAPQAISKGPMSREWEAHVGRFAGLLERDTNMSEQARKALLSAIGAPQSEKR